MGHNLGFWIVVRGRGDDGDDDAVFVDLEVGTGKGKADALWGAAATEDGS